MRFILSAVILMLFTACAGSSMPAGAVAGCGTFAYTGTWTKSQTDMKILWLSEGAITVEQAIELAEAVGCNQD